MTRHSFLLALAATAGLAMPGAALADDDNDAGRILRGFATSQFDTPGWHRDNDHWWNGAYRVGHDDDDDDDDRWDDDNDDDDDRRGDDDDDDD